MDYFRQFEKIAPDLENTQVDTSARVGYDLMVDAIFWSDEYPKNKLNGMAEFDIVRLLLRYRTTCILGSPDESLKDYWGKGKQLFPNWAGFHPDRMISSNEIKEYYERARLRGMKSLERFDKLMKKKT